MKTGPAPGRCLAQHQGWYDRRRLVQETAIPGLLLVMALLAVALWWLMRGHWRAAGPRWSLPWGLLRPVRSAFIMSMRYIDTLIRLDVMHLRLNWLFERAGPVLIGLAGLRLLLRKSAKALDPEMPR